MKRHYTWSIDNTQADAVQATVMIYAGGVEELSSEYIGEFTMFFKDTEQIKAFLNDGFGELHDFVGIMKELDDLKDGGKTDI